MAHVYSYNRQCLLRDGRPWLPAMGEIHFSRVPDESWRESLRLMKTGGIEIAASYVIWIHHEPTEGVFDFTGCRNIRKFLDLCAEEDMAVCLRIGPYIHGEVRHGGLPDWAVKLPGVRSADPAFMSRVRRWWEALYGEIREHIGGCVALIQYDNEYVAPGEGHGDEYMNALVALADEIGIKAPIHTATACRGQFIGSCLPAFGEYPDWPWDRRLTKLPPTAGYLFSRVRDGGQIGKPLTDEERRCHWADPDGIPFLLCEIGGGVQPTMHRRPVIEPKDVGAVVNVKIGSGAVLPGIYMYHGGMNPGRRLNESRSAGDGTDTPEFNYDFQAPVGSFGKPSPVYAELRRMFTFLRDFGESLAVMPAVFPEDNPTDPLDLAHLRYCFRTEGKSGFVFVNNHVRGYETARHTRTFRFPTGDGEVEFPEMTFESGDYGFYPCNMPVGDATLVSANAQPLCILNGKTWVFFTDRKPEYRIQGDLGDAEILTLSEADSLRASKVTVCGRDWLLLCDAPYTQDGDAITFLCRKDTVLKVWPAPDGMTADADGFAAIPLTVPKRACEVGVRLFSENPLMREYALEIPAVPEDAADMILTLDYDGSIAELWRGDEKLADQYSLGSGWQIGMRRYGGGDFLLRVFALAESAPVYMEKRPRFRNGTACCLKDAGAEIEYAVHLESLKTVVRTGDAGAEGSREGEEAR